MSKSHFYFKKHFVLFLSAIYLLNPLQEYLVESMHTLSHLLIYSENSHHEKDHHMGHEYTHEHKVVSFFSKIFSSNEKTSDHDSTHFNYTFDTHFAQAYPKLDFHLKTPIKHIFSYTFHYYTSVKIIPTPPPEVFFS